MLAANSAFAGCETFLAQCGDPAAILDKQGAVVFANAAWLDLWRSTRHDVLGAPATALHPDFHSLLSELKGADGSHASAQMRLGGQQAALRWISVSLSRVVDAGETCYLAIGSDATNGVSLRRNARLVEMMAEATTRMLVVTDRRGDIAFVNRRFSLGLGFSRAEAIGRKTLDLLAGPFTDLRQFARIRRRLLKNDAARGDLLIYDSSGQETWVHVSARLVRNSRGEPVNYAMMLESIGESRKIRTMQQRVLDAIAKDRPLAEVGDILCKNIVAIAPDVTPSVLRVDGDSLVRPVAGRGLPSELTVAIDGLPIGPTQGSCGAAAYLRRPVLARDIETHPNWTPFREPTLSAGLRACWSSPILAKDGRTLGAFAFYFREKRGPSRWHKKIVAAALDLCALAIDRYEAQAQIERLAYFDSLTDLPNRSRLREKFEALISSQQVERAALLFIDIDNFKDVNDTLGHSTGDELLARVARILKSLVRPQDVLARHGGDEFVVVLPDVDVDGASAFADRVRAALAEPAPLGDTMAPVSLSIGVSIYPDDGRDADTLLTNADSAMYAAKRSGRSTHRLFHPSMRRAAEERVACSRALREAIANDGLVLHYQPQVWSGSGVLRGVEALARWRDPVLGDVSPARFIPIAEEYGLIGAIGEWSLRESARQLALWRSQGLAVPRVSVNLAPALLQGRGLLDTIERNLVEFNLHPDDLTIEITEGALMKDRIAGVEAARALHAFGISISLDDFGTGYSNLSRLAQLPIDELKIDRSFMSRIADDPDARAVANIAVQIGKALRMTVVAEGVETHEQKRVLQELGCDVQQGYLFARPMPAAHLGTWLLDAGSDARSESAA